MQYSRISNGLRILFPGHLFGTFKSTVQKPKMRAILKSSSVQDHYPKKIKKRRATYRRKGKRRPTCRLGLRNIRRSQRSPRSIFDLAVSILVTNEFIGLLMLVYHKKLTKCRDWNPLTDVSRRVVNEARSYSDFFNDTADNRPFKMYSWSPLA